MRYKAQVLKHFPNAKLVVRRKWPDTEPRYISVYVNPGEDGEMVLDIHDPDKRDEAYGVQMHGAAWRSAYYWCVRNKAEVAA